MRAHFFFVVFCRRFSCTRWLVLLVMFGLGGPARAALNIITQPVPVNVSSNSSATFSATASGTPPLNFRWRLNGVDIPGTTTTRTNSVATDTFSIQSVQPTNAGSYSVVVWSAEGALNSAAVPLLVTNVPVNAGSDDFNGRQGLSPLGGGVIRSSNTNATREVGEPNHGGKPGNRSVWFKWTATDNGIATFSTRGSGFDTTLGVYTNGQPLTSLIRVAGDDDTGGFLNSTTSFNAVDGKEYSIAVDGFYGARGNFTLAWTLEPTTDKLPEILVPPQDQTVELNNSVTLNAQVDTNRSGIEYIRYQWQKNGSDLIGQTNGTLTFSAVNSNQVGNYTVKVTQKLLGSNNPRTITSPIAQLQANLRDGTAFDPGAIAQIKFRDESDTGGGLGVAAPAAGYSGSQLFSTYGAVKEPGEPNHCSDPGGASYWYSYLPPMNGTLTVDATASFNNILAVYTGNATNFLSLTSVACSNTNSSAGKETAVFAATAGTVYYIVTDGVSGASGSVNLTYTLAAPPVITSDPASRTVVAGSNATLTVAATGSTPLAYQWRTNGINFTGQRTNSLTVSNFTAAKEGGYVVVITNVAGAVTSATAQLYLIASNNASRFTNSAYGTNRFTATLLGNLNTNYVILGATNVAGTWTAISTNSSAVGIISFSETNSPGYTNRFYRARAL